MRDSSQRSKGVSSLELPTVSVIIPVRNEENFIGKCIESFLDQAYPENRFEIIVVDGMSEDNTRTIVKEYMSRYKNIRLYDNPDKYTPNALNIGIKNASGKIIMLASSHAIYSRDYISTCAQKIVEEKAEIVGGKMITLPRNSSIKAKVIASVLSNPFGVGGAKYRIRCDKESYVDTVAYGLYKKELFDKAGLFNENLVRNQDIEMNLRLKRIGARTLLVPQVSSYYYARDTFTSLWKNNFANGFWVIYSTKFAKVPFSFRHLIPLFFVLFLVLGCFLSMFSPILAELYMVVLGLYMLLNVYFSLKISFRLKNLLAFPLAFFTFLSLHVSYGIGSLVALIKLLFGGKK